jgi:hypothetical protein
VRAHPGPTGRGSRPLRGNQEAPSQTGGHARCSSRKTAFVRAPWVGPPNRASPVRAVVIALWRLRAVRERVGRPRTHLAAGSPHGAARHCACAATPQMHPSPVAWRQRSTRGGPTHWIGEPITRYGSSWSTSSALGLSGGKDLQRQDRSQCPKTDHAPTPGRSRVWRDNLQRARRPRTFRERSRTLAWAKPCLVARTYNAVALHTSRERSRTHA